MKKLTFIMIILALCSVVFATEGLNYDIGL